MNKCGGRLILDDNVLILTFYDMQTVFCDYPPPSFVENRVEHRIPAQNVGTAPQ